MPLPDPLRAWIRRHGLDAEAVAELEALWAERAVATVYTASLDEEPTSGTGTIVPEPVRGGDTLPADPGEGPAGFDEVPAGLGGAPAERLRRPAAEPASGAALLAGRYEDLGPIGVGGMGEVRRVRDRQLDRVLAIKLLHPEMARRPEVETRFLAEARTTAQLQHPNVAPVHELGRLPDGRAWFTMKEVRGRTLSEVIGEVHAASRERWEVAASGWSFRRLVTSFHAVCQAVAYAHARGVVHRDLKPANTMVGDLGEVYVLDWGLAKVTGRVEDTESGLGPVTRGSAEATQAGLVAGTPAYMPPEQARGEAVDSRSDVYALGSMLYEILAGRPPFGGSAREALDAVLAGPPPALRRRVEGGATALWGSAEELAAALSGAPLPAELVAACERAMARDPAERFPSAAALAEAVAAWLDGSRRREQALEQVRRAEAAADAAQGLAADARALRAEAALLLTGVAGWEPEERKAAGWRKADEADAVEREARLRELEADEGLQAALRIDPGLPEAHTRLTERHLARHAAAEAARDRRAEAEARTLLEAHASALPEGHRARRRAAAYLAGTGALTLLTDPPGAEVRLYRVEEWNRRLVEVFDRSLGTTPLRAVSLPMGSYVCVLCHPDREELRYPVQVTRQGHWDGVPPGERAPRPVWLPPRGWLGPDERLVPAGWFRAGGDPEAAESFPAARLWAEAFVMERFPVTNARYIAFLDDLVRRGRLEEAERHAPRARAGAAGELGAPIYGFDGGRFFLRPDADGDLWLPDQPVLQVDWVGARAYCAWRAERTGRPWRLPAELEWEKAARGVDGRFHPWGDVLDPSWCCMTDSHPQRRLPRPVDSFPVDTSVYGVRGLGGNVRDWCEERFDRPPPQDGERVGAPAQDQEVDPRVFRVVRGGSWDAAARLARSAFRLRGGPNLRLSMIGWRGVWSVG